MITHTMEVPTSLSNPTVYFLRCQACDFFFSTLRDKCRNFVSESSQELGILAYYLKSLFLQTKLANNCSLS